LTKDILDQALKVIFLIAMGFMLGYLIAGQVINHDIKVCAEAYEEVRQAYIDCEITKNTEVWHNASNRFREFWNISAGD